MGKVRLALRGGWMVGLLIACVPLHYLWKLAGTASPWPRRFLRGIGRAAGMRVVVSGEPLAGGVLFVANHMSWLDIMILAGATDCAFVAKDDLGHGLLHWLADQNATVYVRRSHVKGAKDQAIALAGALAGDKPVTVFPEATTGPGTHLLAFRSTLLEAANYAAKDVAIRPVAVDYGAARAEVGWWHEAGMANVLRILGRRGTLPVTIRLLGPLDRTGDRKLLAAAAREAIGEALGFKSDTGSPIGLSE